TPDSSNHEVYKIIRNHFQFQPYHWFSRNMFIGPSSLYPDNTSHFLSLIQNISDLFPISHIMQKHFFYIINIRLQFFLQQQIQHRIFPQKIFLIGWFPQIIFQIIQILLPTVFPDQFAVFFTFPHFLNAAADVQPLYLFQAAFQKFSQHLFFYFKSSAEWLYPPDSFGIKPVINRFKQNLIPSVNTLLFHLPLPYS